MTSINFYKIYSTENLNKFYIGSSKNPLNIRFNYHKNDFQKQYHKYGLYEAFKIYGVNTFKIELIESKECQSDEERKKIEQQYIDEYRTKFQVYNIRRAYAGKKHILSQQQRQVINDRRRINYMVQLMFNRVVRNNC